MTLSTTQASCLRSFADCTCNFGFVRDEAAGECQRGVSEGSSTALMPCFGAYTCPQHSHVGKVECLRDFDGCDCDWGYTKSGGKCVRQRPTFECPDNSFFSGAEWPGRDFQDDCTCFFGHVKRNGTCVKLAAPAAQRTSGKDRMEWACTNSTNGQRCFATCPRNSWVREWPVTSFDDCSCDWGFERVVGYNGRDGACIDPQVERANQNVRAATFTLELPPGRGWQCGKVITEADSIADIVRNGSDAAAVVVFSDCALPQVANQRRRLQHTERRLLDIEDDADQINVDVYFEIDPAQEVADDYFGSKEQMDGVAEQVEAMMTFAYGSDSSPIVTDVGSLQGQLLSANAIGSDSGGSATLDIDLEDNANDSGGSSSVATIAATVSAAVVVIVAAALVTLRQRRLREAAAFADITDAKAAAADEASPSNQVNPMFSHRKPDAYALKHSRLNKQESIAHF